MAIAQAFRVFERLLLLLATLLVSIFGFVAFIEFFYLAKTPRISTNSSDSINSEDSNNSESGSNIFVLVIFSFYGIFVLFNILFNYYKAVLTNAGRVDQLSVLHHEDRDSDPLCSKCNLNKPPRAHHCKYCKTCILVMDHHCPWINNCVGYFNRRYFILFLFWTGLGIFSFFIIILVHAIKLLKALPLPPDPPIEPWIVYGITFYAFGIALALNGLLATNLYLIGTGQTAIEWAQNRKLQILARQQHAMFHNQWNLGWKQNFIDVFGKKHPLFWILPSTAPPKGNGLDFATVPYVTQV